MVVTLTSFVLFNIHAKKLILRSNIFYLQNTICGHKKVAYCLIAENDATMIMISANQISVSASRTYQFKTQLCIKIIVGPSSFNKGPFTLLGRVLKVRLNEGSAADRQHEPMIIALTFCWMDISKANDLQLVNKINIIE